MRKIVIVLFTLLANLLIGQQNEFGSTNVMVDARHGPNPMGDCTFMGICLIEPDAELTGDDFVNGEFYKDFNDSLILSFDKSELSLDIIILLFSNNSLTIYNETAIPQNVIDQLSLDYEFQTIKSGVYPVKDNIDFTKILINFGSVNLIRKNIYKEQIMTPHIEVKNEMNSENESDQRD